MPVPLESLAEITKLARMLDTDPASLSYLEKVASPQLRELREQVTDVLFDSDRGALQRMAAASRLIPVPVLAKIAEGVFGPLLCARIAGLIDPPRAVEIASRLSPAFLADVAVSLDPRRASGVIAGMPVEQIAAVAKVLLERQELVAMGRFVGHLSDAALRVAVELADEVALLRIAFVLEGKERLEDVLALLPHARLETMVQVAAAEDLWPEVLALLGNISTAHAQAELNGGGPQSSALLAIATIAAELDTKLLERAAVAACDHRLWGPLILLAGLMDEAGQRRVADVIVAAPEPVAASLFDVVAAEQLWAQLLVIAAQLDAAQLEQLALRGGDYVDLRGLIGAAQSDERLWQPGLRLLAGLSREIQQELVSRAPRLSKKQRAQIGEQAKKLELETRLEPFTQPEGKG